MKNKILAGGVSALLAFGALTLAFAAPASAHTPEATATCDALTVSASYYETKPGQDAVPPKTHVEYQRYSWNPKDGDKDRTPGDSTPLNDPKHWQKNTGNYEGAGHGSDPVGEVFQKADGDNASWFFWTSKTITDDEGSAAVSGDATPNTVTVTIDGKQVDSQEFGTSFSKSYDFADRAVAHNWIVSFVAWNDLDGKHGWTKTLTGTSTPCMPTTPPAPTVQQCTALLDGGLSTEANQNGWGFAETRATGHNEYVDGGLHVWTEGATSTDKAAGYKAVSFALKDAGSGFGITARDASGGFPGLQMAVDLDNDGDLEGYLVYEPVYGADTLWLSSNWSKMDLSKAPTSVNGGGTGLGGPINDWLAAYPDAQVHAIGYSLGSGMKGDLVIEKITVGCAYYTFTRTAQPADHTEWGTWSNPVITCDNEAGDVVQQYRTNVYVTTEWKDGQWVEVRTEKATHKNHTVTQAEIDALKCAVTPPVVTPTPTPTTPAEVVPAPTTPKVTPARQVSQTLAVTGGDVIWPLTLGALAVAGIAGGILLLLIRRRTIEE